MCVGGGGGGSCCHKLLDEAAANWDMHCISSYAVSCFVEIVLRVFILFCRQTNFTFACIIVSVFDGAQCLTNMNVRILI